MPTSPTPRSTPTASPARASEATVAQAESDDPIQSQPEGEVPAKSAKRRRRWGHRDPEQSDRLQNERGRLPDGATFGTHYDAARVRWTGKLEIPGVPMFEADASGVFTLLEKLDKQYRAWAKRGGETAANADPNEPPAIKT
jgi:hypothetical protein